jgi:hypothetical protein
MQKMADHKIYFACAEVPPRPTCSVAERPYECVKLDPSTCFFTDSPRSICKYVPEKLQKVVFEVKYKDCTLVK